MKRIKDINVDINRNIKNSHRRVLPNEITGAEIIIDYLINGCSVGEKKENNIRSASLLKRIKKARLPCDLEQINFSYSLTGSRLEAIVFLTFKIALLRKEIRITWNYFSDNDTERKMTACLVGENLQIDESANEKCANLKTKELISEMALYLLKIYFKKPKKAEKNRT